MPQADGLTEIADPAQTADTADTAGPPETADPAQTADLAGEPDTAQSIGPSCMDKPAQQAPASSAGPAEVAGPSQENSAEVSHNVLLPQLTFKHDHTPLHEIPVTHQRPADNPDISDASVATFFPSIPKVINQAQLLDFIAMMNLVQQKGETQDVTAGLAIVSSPRTVVRKSPSPPPSRYAWDRTPDRSRSPVKILAYRQDRSSKSAL